MRYKILVSVLCITIGCSSAKKETVIADGTQVITDSVRTTVSDTYTDQASESDTEQKEVPPPKNFPAFSAVLEDDELEQSLIALLKEYDAKDYQSIRQNYEVSYRAEVGIDDIADITEYETKIWYYDSAFRLRCYTRTFDYSNGYDIDRKQILSTYLFDDDSLIAIYEDDGERSHMRVLASRCPDCGISFGLPLEDGQTFYLNKNRISKLSDEFYTEYDELLNLIKTKKAKKVATPDDSGEEYALKKDLEIADVPYTVECFVDIPLYDRLVKENNP